MRELSTGYEIVIDLPGVLNSEAKLCIKDRIITVTAKIQGSVFEGEDESGVLVCKSVQLPGDANENEIEASLNDNEIAIRIQKIAPGKKTIP